MQSRSTTSQFLRHLERALPRAVCDAGPRSSGDVDTEAAGWSCRSALRAVEQETELAPYVTGWRERARAWPSPVAQRRLRLGDRVERLVGDNQRKARAQPLSLTAAARDRESGAPRVLCGGSRGTRPVRVCAGSACVHDRGHRAAIRGDARRRRPIRSPVHQLTTLAVASPRRAATSAQGSGCRCCSRGGCADLTMRSREGSALRPGARFQNDVCGITPRR